MDESPFLFGVDDKDINVLGKGNRNENFAVYFRKSFHLALKYLETSPIYNTSKAKHLLTQAVTEPMTAYEPEEPLQTKTGGREAA